MLTWLSVAAGGAIGASLRYGVNIASIATFGVNFPAATMIVNILGSLLLGVLTGVFTHFYAPSPEIKAFLVTGMLGAFTTFSTFSLDNATLFERGEYGLLAAYLIGSIILGIAAFFIGLHIIRLVAS